MEDINFVIAKLFPWLSVTPWSRISPAAPAGQESPKEVMHTRVAESSKDAIVL